MRSKPGTASSHENTDCRHDPGNVRSEYDGQHMTLETNDYAAFLTDLKTRIRAARTKAALVVKRELVLLCWQIGQGIAVGKSI
jgi:hypothetical protein